MPCLLAERDLRRPLQPFVLGLVEQGKGLLRQRCVAHLVAVWRGEGNATLDQGLQRLGTHRSALEQADIEAEATAVPETAATAHERGVAWLDQDMDQHAIRCLPQLVPRDLAHRHFTVGDRHTDLDRPASSSAEHHRQASLASGQVRWLGQGHEVALRALILRRRLHFKVLTGDQRLQVGRLDDTQRRLDYPELRTHTRNTLGHLGDLRLERHRLQVLRQVHRFDLADIQPLEAYGGADLEAVRTVHLDGDAGAFAIRRFLVGQQAEGGDTTLERYILFRRIEGDATGHQALQRLALDLDARQAASQGNAAGVPETRRTIDQVGVLGLDVHANQQALLLPGELVALHATHLYLPIQDRAANLERAQVVTEQHKVQAGRLQIEGRGLGPGFEFPLWRGALVAGTDSNVVALYQRLQAGDTRQGDRRLDHPELGAFDQVVLGQRVQGQLGHGTGEVGIDLQGFQRTYLYTFVHDWRTARLQALEVAQLDLNPDTRLGGVEVFEKTERQVRVGGRAVLAVLGGSECDTAGNDAGQGLAAHLHARQVGIDAHAAGVPETRVLTHQVGIARLDEHLDLDRTLVVGELVALHPANLDLLVEHGAVTVERPQTIGLEGQMQAGHAVGHRRCFAQRIETLARLAIARAHGNVVA
uniref:NAD-specific glutamate dehydrogenase n=1 Tax=Parastrongyloides trichosuri TaxID=131310 RepID=A0A0N5A5U9_PARTI